MQIIAGGQKKQSLVTLMLNNAKITEIRQSKDTVGNFGRQKRSCILFQPQKKIIFCRKSKFLNIAKIN